MKKFSALLLGGYLILSPQLHAVAGSAPQVLRDQFRAAATEFSVPQALLETIAYLETGWRPGAPSSMAAASIDLQDDHDGGGVGIMALREDSSDRGLLKAAALLQLTEKQLRESSLHNIRGAAALLANLAQIEKIPSYGEGLSEQNIAGWFRVVAKFSALEAYKTNLETGQVERNLIEEDRQRASYAEGVLLQMMKGFEVDGLLVPGVSRTAAGAKFVEAIDLALSELRSKINFLTPLELLSAKLGKLDGAEFPGAKFKRSPWMKAGGPAKKYIVIHSTEGSYAGAINHLTSLRNRKKTSAHYVIRSVDGEITQLVGNTDRSVHACGRNMDKERWNDVSIGIEHEGWADKSDWQTESLYKASAKLVAHLLKTFSIPPENILSHADAFEIQKRYNGGGCEGRTDPGKFWDWSYFGELVRFFLKPPSLFGSVFND